MSVVITTRAKNNIRNFYLNSTRNNINQRSEATSLVDAITQLIQTTPLTISKEDRGILNIWRGKGYSIFETTHYFRRLSNGISVKPMASRQGLKRKWYLACIVDRERNQIYIANAVYAKYVDRIIDNTPTALKLMSALKGIETKRRKEAAQKLQLTIPFNYEENNINLNKENTHITMNKNKKIVRLTESDLHNMITEAVKVALNELDPRTYASYADKRRQQGIELSRQGDTTYERMMNQKKNAQQLDNLRNKISQGQEFARNAWNREYGYSDSQDVRDEDSWNVYQSQNKMYAPQRADDGNMNYYPTKGYEIIHHFSKGDNRPNYANHFTDNQTKTKQSVRAQEGNRVARQMQDGSGTYVRGKGWQ